MRQEADHLSLVAGMSAVAKSILLGQSGCSGCLGCHWWRCRGSLGAASFLSSQVHIANQCEGGRPAAGAAAGDKEVQVPGALEAVAAMVAPLPRCAGPRHLSASQARWPGGSETPTPASSRGSSAPTGLAGLLACDPLCSLCLPGRRPGEGAGAWVLGGTSPQSLPLQRRTVVVTLWCARRPAVQAQCRRRTSAALCARVSALQEWRCHGGSTMGGSEASGEGGPTSAFIISLDPQRNKMSKTSRGCQGTGTWRG